MKYITMLLAAVGLQSGSEAAPQPQGKIAYGSGECSFVVPEDLGSGAISWVGECPGGYAEGPGVMRVVHAQKVHLFAGELRRGRPVAGFLDTGSPETTGSVFRLEGRRALQTRGRGELHKGCVVAAGAADKAAARYRRARNAGSAKFYADWAKRLRRCLDGTGE